MEVLLKIKNAAPSNIKGKLNKALKALGTNFRIEKCISNTADTQKKQIIIKLNAFTSENADYKVTKALAGISKALNCDFICKSLFDESAHPRGNGGRFITKYSADKGNADGGSIDANFLAKGESEFVETLSEISESRESTNPLFQQDKRLFNILQAESLRKSLDYQLTKSINHPEKPSYQAHQDIIDNSNAEVDKIKRQAYNFICKFLGLPNVTEIDKSLFEESLHPRGNGERFTSKFAVGSDYEKLRSPEEQEKKREELNVLVPNSITQKGTPLPATASGNEYNTIQKNVNINDGIGKSVNDKLTVNGKIIFDPLYGKPLKQKDFELMIGKLENFLSRRLADSERKLLLQSTALGHLIALSKSGQTQLLSETTKLKNIKLNGKSFESLCLDYNALKNNFNKVTDEEIKKLQFVEEKIGVYVANAKDVTIKIIKDIYYDAVINHKSKQEIAQEMYDKLGFLNRSWDTIARTESNNLKNHAFLAGSLNPSGKTYFRRRVGSYNTCKTCQSHRNKIALWVDFPLADDKINDKVADIAIWSGKTNIGRNQKDWWIPEGSTHPNCFCEWEKLHDSEVKYFCKSLFDESAHSKNEYDLNELEKSIQESTFLNDDALEYLIKSHKYSRKVFKNGTWYYYYDKHNNFAGIAQCTSNPLLFSINKKLSKKDQCKQVEQQAVNYIKNVWLKDWQNTLPTDKSICKELRNKKIVFENISYKHLSTQGNNSKGGKQQRTLQNMLDHVKYLPCAKELLESTGVWTHARYEIAKHPHPDKTGKKVVGYVYQTLTGKAPIWDKTNKYVQVTVSKVKYSDNTYGDTVYISVVGVNKIAKSIKPFLPRKKALTAIPCKGVRLSETNIVPGGTWQDYTKDNISDKDVRKSETEEAPSSGSVGTWQSHAKDFIPCKGAKKSDKIKETPFEAVGTLHSHAKDYNQCMPETITNSYRNVNINDEIGKSLFDESLHPRGNGGRFIAKLAPDSGNNGGSTNANFLAKGESEWGTVYEMESGTPLDAVKFLMENKDGFIENVFVGKNKQGRSFKVGLCWGDEYAGLEHIIGKHIIQYSDFETLEDLIKVIQNVLIYGKKENYSRKVEFNNGKFRVVLAQSKNGEFVITAFNSKVDDYHKQRSPDEQKKKRKELNL